VHLYTVDRHLMQTAVECARLVRRVERPDLLMLAALLHDIGKGTGRDHSVAGAEMVGAWLERMGVAKPDIETIVVLIRHHLLLSETATRRDPDDPATAASVAAAIGDVPTLDLLAALTEADSLAAGPAAWTTWKARQVAQLTDRVRTVLQGVAPAPRTEPELDLPLGGGTGVTVVIDHDQVTVTVVAPDRPGLLAAAAGALSLQRLSVHGASVRSSGGVAGQRWIAAPEFGDPPDPATVRAEMTRALNDPVGTAARVARRRVAAEPTSAVPPSVTVVADASDAATVVEVRAHDASGLLHTIAAAVAARGLSVISAVVHTWGAEAVDVLYVQTVDGRPLSPAVAADLARAIETELLPG
jgi:[protein-PII] uridylyltransferase